MPDPAVASRPLTPAKRPSGTPVRWFYPFAGVVMLAATLVGFQQFYFHGRSFPDREITPPIRTLVIVHGVAMALWILLGLVQPSLVAVGKRKLHMTLGPIGVALAATVFVLGLMVGVQSIRVMPPEAMLFGFHPKEFLAVPLLSVVLFGITVGAAVWYRRKPAAHRSLMLTATLFTISAALNRIQALNDLYMGSIWDRIFGPFFMGVLLALLLLGLRCALIRGLDRWLAGGVAAVTACSALIVWLSRTPAWDAFATKLVGG